MNHRTPNKHSWGRCADLGEVTVSDGHHGGFQKDAETTFGFGDEGRSRTHGERQTALQMGVNSVNKRGRRTMLGTQEGVSLPLNQVTGPQHVAACHLSAGFNPPSFQQSVVTEANTVLLLHSAVLPCFPGFQRQLREPTETSSNQMKTNKPLLGGDIMALQRSLILGPCE